MREMKGIEPEQTAVVAPRYVLELFTESSLESQKMRVYVDESGEGYFSQISYNGSFRHAL